MSEKRYTVGTLVYTKAGLVTLFGWLLWGDFIYTLMEQVMPTLVPLLLKQHGATNAQIAICVGSIANLLNMLMNPVISYNSDRCRTRWGRRRPFILFTTIPVVLFMASVPFAPEILKLILTAPGIGLLQGHSPVPGVILMFGVLVVGFQIFNMFVSSVYYYLIPDVVPEALIGRFYGLFRIFGAAAGLIYQYFIFGRAEGHMRAIFVGVALLYGVAIMMMCWRVKEGEYPPPPEEAGGHWWSGIRNYGVECFGKLRYWLIFMGYASFMWAGAGNMFLVFFYRDEIGLSLAMQGKVNSLGIVLIMLVNYPIGVLTDRWGGGWSYAAGSLLKGLLGVLAFFFITGTWSVVVLGVVLAVPNVLAYSGVMKWVVEVYPPERYGQYSSAGAIFAALGLIVLSPVCAKIVDVLGLYRMVWLWFAFFSFFGAIAICLVMRMDRRAGAQQGGAVAGVLPDCV